MIDMEGEKELYIEPGHDLEDKTDDPFIRFLHKIIRLAVKVLALLMVLVIVWGIGDVIYVLYQRLVAPPFMLLSIGDILATFGAFLAVLIAISRKVIIFDFGEITPLFVLATGAVGLALGITYWLISKKN